MIGNRRLRMGMIGGGPGSFIGPVHRIAAELDREIELVAGAFSSNAERSREAGSAYRIDPDRAYPDVATMLAAEATRSDGIDFVTIASPNRHHLPAARAALEAGIAVLSDKPATATLAEARELAEVIARCGRPYGLTYTYSGFPLAREARALVASGAIGQVRKVVVEYAQGWLARQVANKQAAWRTDPTQAGDGGAIADIGVHAFHLAEFVTGLRVTQLFADLASVVPGRTLDDDCQLLLRFDNGARGALLASQVMTGEQNRLGVRVYGDRGALEWQQERNNELVLRDVEGRTTILRTGDPGLSEAAQAATRLPGGHPEGYLEAFANLYRDFARQLRGEPGSLLPGIDDGLRGMALIDLSVTASRERAGWVPFEV